jgi:hypothetical protein
MRITSVEKLEDCFDGSSVYCYHFDQPSTRAEILQLASLGRLEYFVDFPRPFYRLIAAGGPQLKGVEGTAHCRVVVSREAEELFRQGLQALLSKP